jgi:hypothetical protein
LDGGLWRGSPAGANHGEGLGGLALGHGHQGEDTILYLDDGVIALSHAEQQGIGADRE